MDAFRLIAPHTTELRSIPQPEPGPRGLPAEVKALGWGVLASVAGREVVVGAVTRPWQPDVTFRALPPEEFAGFSEPGYVKIAWTGPSFRPASP